MLTVQEYADQRGCAPKTVYNAIKKHGLMTIDGVSNGKAAQLLDDETIEKLNQLIRTTPQELTILKQQLETREADYKLALNANREAMQAKDDLAREKDHTREIMLQRVSEIERNFSSDLTELHSDFMKQLADKEDQISKLKNKLGALSKENTSLKAQIKELSDQLTWSQEHPLKNAWKYMGGQKNAPAEGNKDTSNTDS